MGQLAGCQRRNFGAASNDWREFQSALSVASPEIIGKCAKRRASTVFVIRLRAGLHCSGGCGLGGACCG